MTQRLLSGIACAVLAASIGLAAQGRAVWDDLYREAIRHVRQQEWLLAEQKLNESRKTGPPSGRGVIRRGLMGRDDYFPEFYLGVVYLNTGRVAMALPSFQEARQRGLNPRDGDFRQIDGLEARAKSILAAEAKVTPPPSVDTRPQFKGFLDSARKLLSEARFDDAEAAAKQARELNVDNAAVDAVVQSIETRRREARLERQLKASLSLPELRRLLNEYENTGVSLDEVKRRIAAAEAIEARAAGERTGMIEFYTGNYQKALGAIVGAEKIAPLSPRGNFYRALVLASLATRGKTTNQTQLREARRFYTLAAQNAEAFKGDLRYVSPRILQLLQGS